MKILLSTIAIIVAFTSLGQLNAEFSVSDLEVCIGDEIQFTDLSTAGSSPIVSWTWDFGDGNNFVGQNASHTYSIPGTYNITLTVQAQNGTSDFEFQSQLITVNDLPNVDFSLNSTACSVPFDAAFTNSSEFGANYSFEWSFGNGQVSSDYTPTGITYNSAGDYDVTLTVTNNNTGCSNTLTESITVYNYTAGIFAPTTACLGESVTIISTSTIGTNSWFWQFGDGSTSSLENNSHVYNTPGTHTISLTAQNTSLGCSDVITHEIEILDLPTPSFSADETIGCAPLDVTFSNLTGDPAATYEWDFGNGNTFSGETPGVQQYGANGSYDVSLTMTDANGCTNTDTIFGMITVQSLDVNLVADITEGCEPIDVQFTDISNVPNPGSDPIVSWSWNFGNGNTFNGEVPPVQTYNVGTYDVTLTITTANGCSDDTTLVEYIQVGAIDLVNFSLDPPVQCAKDDVEFTNLSVISVPHDLDEVEYFWDFGDGGTSTQENPTYTYPIDTGYFDVKLVVTFRGCSDSITIPQAVYIKAPISRFSTETLYCNPDALPLTVDVLDNSIIGEESDDAYMIWTWGDGTFTHMDDPDFDDGDLGSTSHDYTAFGTYTIQQAIYNYTTGCEDSTTVTINISNTEADFTFSNDSVCRNSSITLVDASTSSHAFGTFSYDMGNGTTIYGPNQIYTYTTAGQYDIVISATNVVGCADTDTLFGMDVLELPVASISPSTFAGCAPLDVVFSNASSSQGNGVGLDSFLWTFPDGSTQTTNDVSTDVNYVHTSNLPTEVFTTYLEVTDEFGCVSPEASVNITLTKPTAAFLVDTVVCDLENYVTTNNSVGTGALTYEWHVDDVLSSNQTNYIGQFDEDFSPSYNVVDHELDLIVTDGNGCMDTASAVIHVSMPYADLTYSFSGASVNGDGDYVCPPVFATLEETSSSYGDITNWNWTFGNGNTSIDPGVTTNTYVFAGTYSASLNIVDEYGCTADTTLIDYLTITGPTAEPMWINIGDQCNPEYEFSVGNLVNVTNIDWDLGDGNSQTGETTFTHPYNVNGTYSPIVTISDENGCEIPYELDPIVINTDVLNAYFTYTPESGNVTEEFIFTDESTGGSGPIIIWDWDFTTNSVLNNTDADVSQIWYIPGEHTVTLSIEDINGCTGEYSVEISVSGDVTVPNVFTPNGDGTNDLFTLDFDIFESYTILILNRWGQVLHEIKDHTGVVLWDGKDDSGKECVDGVYFYKIDGILFDGNPVSKHGPVTLLRGE